MARKRYLPTPSYDNGDSDDQEGGKNDRFNHSVTESPSDITNMYGTHLLTKDDFTEQVLKNIAVDNDILKTLCVTRVSHRIRRLLRHFGNTAGAEEIIFLANQKCRLFATRAIREGEFVLAPVPVLLASPEECGRDVMGVSLPNIILYGGLHSDFQQYEIIAPPESRKRKRNTESFMYRRKIRALEAKYGSDLPEPQQKYCSDDEENQTKTAYDKYDICIDVTNSSDEMKAIRRNCLPNCAVRYVILHQRMEVFITAQSNIQAHEELTIAHDYDSNMSHKIIKCAHPYDPNDLCLHEVSQRSLFI
ncbi:hypothetical protein GCK72_016403 [Caenorhabditis remanei]|uniref:SET domain-containing protein n=1 Tax=Caenorhabditis remanei TaxID=31234 RepID=A0A6A5G4B8_CAERE|nr:hypothetical protein GCK72_016403 [Caenorhabditis remanei]KAF1749858.1 hypothetical protein GCK72_016403 [Caenorhabditis remanei]